MTEKEAKVVLTALNDYNCGLELCVWIRDERQHIPMRFELREAVYEAVRSAEVDMPYETLVVHKAA